MLPARGLFDKLQMGEYWRFRIGDTKVVCNILGGQVTVLVLEIGNRREVYR
jgi:mRNA interferase RelE/StbE